MVLLIELPDGRVLEEEFKAGVNVEWVAYQLSLKTEFDFKSIALYHEGAKLLNPLALCDYPRLTDRSVIRLQIEDIPS